MTLFDELKRRNIFRVATAYVMSAWLLIQIVETIFPAFGFGDMAVRATVIVLGIGFIPALVFAWAFEKTPEGIKRESDVDRSKSIAGKTGHKLDRIIIAVLVLALGFFVYDKVNQTPTDSSDWFAKTNQPGAGEDAKSIAVLPFTNMSGDPANEPFTLGIHDDLLTHLSRISALKTTSRTTVMQYKDTTKTIPEIAAELGVSRILEGGIQRSGDRVRINLQLIDASTDEHLWAEIYDRELTAENIFAVQGEIATEVAKSMRATLLPEEQSALGHAPTLSMAAYDLYLLGRHHWNQRTAEGIEQARGYFARAIEEDPEYALAYSGLSDSYVLLVTHGNMRGNDAIPLAQAAVDQAMGLDDSLSEVWASQGLLFLLQQKYRESADALERALELDEQNFSAWLWYSNSMRNMRRFEEELKAMQNAYALEPMSVSINTNLASSYLTRGEFVSSREHFERTDQLDDLHPSLWKEKVADTYYWSGDLVRSITESRQILAIDPGNLAVIDMLVEAYLVLGDFHEADRWANQGAKIDTFNNLQYKVSLAQADFEGANAYTDDEFLQFRAAYLGGQIETAKSYLAEYLAQRGGRQEVNPSDHFQWNNLLLANFLMKYGDEGPGGSGQGRKMRDEAFEGLSNLNAQNFNHPGTYYGLAMARTMQDDHSGALDALEEAVNRGFRDRIQLAMEPALGPLHDDERFQAITVRLDLLIADEQERLAGVSLAPYTPLSDRELVIVPRETLEKYAGYYSDGNVVQKTFLDDNGKFHFQRGQSQPVEFLATAQGEFYIERARVTLHKFHTDEQGTVTHMTRHQKGQVRRYKAVEPPPPAVQLDRTILERYEGTYAARRVTASEGGPADTDIWTGIISLDEEDRVWIDWDNQPRKEIKPYSETEFFMPGYDGTMRFETDTQTGAVSRMLFIASAIELEFERQ